MTVERLDQDDLGEPDTTLPPHDFNAERAIIGAVLKDSLCMSRITHLNPDDFYSAKHRATFRAMRDLWDRSEPCGDYTTLGHRLDAPDLSKFGVDMLFLSEINLSIPSSANVEHYARIVQDTATQRRYATAAQRIAELSWRPGADIDRLTNEIETVIASARPSRSRRGLANPQQWADEFLVDFEARQSGERQAISTGLIDIDALMLGMEAGRLYLLMGTPGTGKSELAMQIAMHVGQTHGPVLFASLEMERVELGQRYIRIKYGVDRNNLATGNLTDHEMALVTAALNDMAKSRFWPASSTPPYTTSDLRADAMEVQAEAGKISLIVADYVQRLDDGDGIPSHREINVGMVAKALKSMAREFGCPVLAPVQANREHAQRPNKRPLLTDLRESGKLEQEADVVLGLYRDEKHNEDTRDRGIAEVHMLKNRSGAGQSEGMRKLAWRNTK